LGSSSPAGLRLEIGRESDKKKMNLIFDYARKIFLTEKIKGAFRSETETARRKGLSRTKSQEFGIAAPNGFRV
jgi:hypothetical protein